MQAPTIICQALFDHWQSIVNILTNYLGVLKSNYVPSFLISKMFTQVFSFIDVQLFNSLLLSECCSFCDGEYIKAGLAKLEQWCTYDTEEYAGSSWEELKHIRKAAIFLTMRRKHKKTLKEITSILCPVLSIPQIYRICTLYRDDNGSNDDSPLIDVLSSMENQMTEDVNDPVDYSLLLDHDSARLVLQ
jgi:myosin-5